ncbi:MAG TPA: hypothetical protein EYQ31_16980, partial [Candidatus Handelsmanbacteria bacterium]|nr:hypothetical protein [Candidatus Handelsmanbacteria bacterium]
MAVWLDIIGSFLFGSLLVLNVLRLNGDMTDQSYRTILEYTAQSGALSVALIVDEDSRKAGYGVTGAAITIADTADIEFLSDLGADGSVDTLRYYLGDLVTTTP